MLQALRVYVPFFLFLYYRLRIDVLGSVNRK
jgi:hypothetical protein